MRDSGVGLINHRNFVRNTKERRDRTKRILEVDSILVIECR